MCRGREAPALTVDAIIQKNDGTIVLIKRKKEPFRECWALPGGFVECGETVEQAAKRESKEETGLDVSVTKLVNVYSDPMRDPRGHVVSICFLTEELGGKLFKETPETFVQTFNRDELKNLKFAFDHLQMLKDANIL
ncbi:MAG: NUDIX hydrolase [Euryarchaeota archaeon]|nr:NUDIX hydrolase [Euryarchaeota archaeon]